LLSIEDEYILSYAKNINKILFNKNEVDVENDTKYNLVDKHVNRRGKYYLRDLQYGSSRLLPSSWTIDAPDGTKLKSDGNGKTGHSWRWGQEKVKWGLENEFIEFKKNEHDNWKVYIKQYQFVDNEDNLRIRKIPFSSNVTFLNSEASQELNKLFTDFKFSYPKPTSLIKYLINLIPDKDL